MYKHFPFEPLAADLSSWIFKQERLGNFHIRSLYILNGEISPDLWDLHSGSVLVALAKQLVKRGSRHSFDLQGFCEQSCRRRLLDVEGCL